MTDWQIPGQRQCHPINLISLGSQANVEENSDLHSQQRLIPSYSGPCYCDFTSQACLIEAIPQRSVLYPNCCGNSNNRLLSRMEVFTCKIICFFIMPN